MKQKQRDIHLHLSQMFMLSNPVLNAELKILSRNFSFFLIIMKKFFKKNVELI